MEESKITNSDPKQGILYVLLYIAIVVLCLSLGYLLIDTLILTIPFVIIPFTFALHASISTLNSGYPYSTKVFFVNYLNYFKPHFCGGYKVIFASLKAIGIFIALDTIISTPYISIALQNDPVFFQTLFDAIYSGKSDAALLQIIYNHTDYAEFVILSSAIAFLFASLEFIYHITTHSLKMSLMIHNNTESTMREINIIHQRKAFRMYRQYFYRNYFKNTWYCFLVFIGGYIVGSLLAYFFIRHEVEVVLVSGLIGGMIAISPFAIHIINLIEKELMKNVSCYTIASLMIAVQHIEQMIYSGGLKEDKLMELEEQRRKLMDEIHDLEEKRRM